MILEIRRNAIGNYEVFDADRTAYAESADLRLALYTWAEKWQDALAQKVLMAEVGLFERDTGNS
jgi:hypothetical protein